MRLADKFGQPLSQVAVTIPAWELAYWSVWLARTPTEGNRIEWQLAAQRSEFLAANSKKGTKVPQPGDLIPADFWEKHDERIIKKDSAEDAENMATAFRQQGLTVNINQPGKPNNE